MAASATLLRSIAIGDDGLGLISYYRRHSTATSRWPTATTPFAPALPPPPSTPNGVVGMYTSIAIGADGLGLISYWDGSNWRPQGGPLRRHRLLQRYHRHHRQRRLRRTTPPSPSAPTASDSSATTTPTTQTSRWPTATTPPAPAPPLPPWTALIPSACSPRSPSAQTAWDSSATR